MKKIFSLFLVSISIATAPHGLLAQANESRANPTLNHVALYVVNLKNSAGFYQHIIQLDTIPNPFNDGRHTWFAIGPLSHLHIIQGAKDFQFHDKNTHLCFTVSSVADFIKVLEKHHVEYENWAGQKMQVTNRVDGVKQIYYKDPDGYWLEINDARY